MNHFVEKLAMLTKGKTLVLALGVFSLLLGCNSNRRGGGGEERQIYTITFNANGGALAQGVNGTQAINSGEKATRPSDPTRANYKFSGWATTPDGSAFFDFNSPISANTTLYAKWEINAYTITFNANGGALAQDVNETQTINSGEKATRPSDPTRANYKFSGWTTTPDGSGIFDFNSPVSANTTLYAKWEINAYTVTFNGNDGVLVQGTDDTQQVNYGEKATRPSDPTRVGYKFSGWATTPDGSGIFDFNSPVSANITLYAKWEINAYTVTLDANGGVPAEGTDDTQQINRGGTAQKPSDPMRANYKFLGWTTTPDGSAFFDFNSPLSANTTLYAKWEINAYTVTLDANGGELASGTNASQQINHGALAKKPSDPTRVGYDFLVWTRSKDGGNTDTFDFGRPITADITVYAKWRIKSYVVTLNLGGGRFTSGTDNTQRVNHGEKATRPSDPTRVGRKFLGWKTTEDGDDEFNFDRPITADTMIYAKWVAIDMVTFNADGGTLAQGATTQAQEVNRGEKAISPGDPTRSPQGSRTFHFAYWSKDRKAEFDIDNTAIAGAITLYAMWGVDVPDSNFRTKLKSEVPSAFDGDRLLINHVDVTEETNLDLQNSDISDLSGIEFFTDLLNLDCGANRLTSLDISKNTELVTLEASANQLTSIDVSKNTALERLNLYDNQLSALNVSKNTALEELTLRMNKLTTLDVSQNTRLTTLDCQNNELAALDVSQNTALTILWCNDNKLSSLDMRGMRTFDAGKLIINNNPTLTSLKVHANLKDNTQIQALKTDRGNNLVIETYTAVAGASAYTLECANYDPATQTCAATTP